MILAGLRRKDNQSLNLRLGELLYIGLNDSSVNEIALDIIVFPFTWM